MASGLYYLEESICERCGRLECAGCYEWNYERSEFTEKQAPEPEDDDEEQDDNV